MGCLETLAHRPITVPLRYAWRRSRETLHYLRGRNILRRYTGHHRRARRIFEREGHQADFAVGSVWDVGVRVLSPGATDNLIDLPDNYAALVARISKAAKDRFEETSNCRFFPALPDGPVAHRTDDVPAVRNGDVITIQLLEPYDLDGVADLSVPIMRELERKIFGSYAIVDKLYVYRTPVSRQDPRASWLWHYDNHPRETLKVMFYLTPVSEGTAPFEYLRRADSSQPLYGSPLAPLFGHSRIGDETIEQKLAAGYERHSVFGPAGTLLLFDENVVHRGTLATRAYRDVLVFQVRPVAFAARPYINERWTGSFQHVDFNRDPFDLSLHRRKSKES